MSSLRVLGCALVVVPQRCKHVPQRQLAAGFQEHGAERQRRPAAGVGLATKEGLQGAEPGVAGPAGAGQQRLMDGY